MLDTECIEAEIKELYMEDNITKDIIIQKLIKHFAMTKEKAVGYVDRFVE